MKWSDDLQPLVRENVPLADKTWYRLGGSARYFCVPSTRAQVSEIVRYGRQHNLPVKVLGAGANVLVRDEGYPGIVLHLSPEAFGRIRFEAQQVIAGAAAELPDLVRRTVKRGWGGLEFMAGIPGSVGGAVGMNAGGKFGEIGTSVRNVTLVTEHGTLEQWDTSRLNFQYRSSNLREYIILEVLFDLKPVDQSELSRRYKDIWEFKKQTQPFTRNNAGCMFKNPTGRSAGELIDRAGLKGWSCGGASVSTQHANFIVAAPRTPTADILQLADHVRKRVHEEFNVNLEFEIDIW